MAPMIIQLFDDSLEVEQQRIVLYMKKALRQIVIARPFENYPGRAIFHSRLGNQASARLMNL